MNLTTAERNQLSAILGCDRNMLTSTLRRYEDAAKEEWVRMILGQKVFTRGTDVREYRLFLMIQQVFGGRLPSEKTISGHFQTTTTQSRALLRAVMSKYQYELQGAIRDTLTDHLNGATQSDDETWSMVVDSENVVEALNREVATIDGTLPQIAKSRGTVITYEIQNSTYVSLRQRFPA